LKRRSKLSENKRIAVNSMILYFRLIVTTIVGVLATRLVVKNLGIPDYGLYSIVGSVVLLMGFLNTVMISTTYRFIAFEMGIDNGRNVNKVFNISLTIHLALAFMVVLFSETVGLWYVKNILSVDSNRLNDAIFVFRFSVLATIINIVSIPYQGLVTAKEKFSIRASIEIIRSLLNLGLVIILGYSTGSKLRNYAVMMACLTAIPSLLFYYYCKIHQYELMMWNFQRDRKKYKEMLSYSGWIVLGAAAHVGKDTGSQLLINSFFGTVLNAAFGIANRLNVYVKTFSQSLGQAAIPQITKSYSRGDPDRTLQLVAHISKYSFFLMLIPSLPILVETEYLLHLWLGEIPAYTVSFTRLMIINGLIDSLFAGVPNAVQATGKIKWFQIISSSIMLLSLPIIYVLFRFGFDPVAVQVVYISTTILNLVVSLYLLKISFNFNVTYLIKTSYVKVLFVISLISPIIFAVKIFDQGVLEMILTSFILVLWSIAMIILVGLDSTERKLIMKNILYIMNKNSRK
jgi:O-antigen/teichoic acid export membrane protein